MIDLILENLEKQWDWDVLSNNVAVDSIVNYPHLSWNWKLLSNRIPLNTILEHKIWNWDWTIISLRTELSRAIKYPELYWNWDLLRGNINVKQCEKIQFLDSTYLSSRVSDSISNIIKSDIKWDMTELSKNKHLDKREMLKHSDLDWDWMVLSKNTKPELIIQFSHLPWVDPELPFNYNAKKYLESGIRWKKFISPMLIISDIQLMKKYHNMNWDWNHLSKADKKLYAEDPIIMWKFKSYKHHNLFYIEENLDKPWDFHELSRRHDIIPLVKKYTKFPGTETKIPWDWEYLGSHAKFYN